METIVKQTELKIKANDIRYEYFRFICNAVAESSTRYTLRNVLIEDGKIVATDGRRLHIIETDTEYLEPGQWEVIKNTKALIWIKKTDEIGVYPNWQDIAYQDSTEPIEIKYANLAIYFHSIYNSNKVTCCNPDYIYDSYIDSHVDYEINFFADTQGDPDFYRPITIKSQNPGGSVKATRIIMPISI